MPTINALAKGNGPLPKGKEIATILQKSGDHRARAPGTGNPVTTLLQSSGLKRGAYLSSGSVYIIEYLCSSGQYPADDMGV